MVRRNANHEASEAHGEAGHYYVPYTGHRAASDFRRLRDDPLILFEDELPNIYRLPGGSPR
jgi:hypothetical protein